METLTHTGLIKVAFDKTAYELKYQKQFVWQVKLNFNRNTDTDIIEKLMSVPNRLGYIKALIRADIEKNK